MVFQSLVFKFYKVEFNEQWQLGASSLPSSDQIFKYNLISTATNNKIPATVNVYYEVTAGMVKTAIVKCPYGTSVSIHNDVIHFIAKEGEFDVLTLLNDLELG